VILAILVSDLSYLSAILVILWYLQVFDPRCLNDKLTLLFDCIRLGVPLVTSLLEIICVLYHPKTNYLIFKFIKTDHAEA